MREPESEDERPESGDPSDGVPGLPPEWGRIVVPDDPAALAAEAEAVRRELRRRAGSRSSGPGRWGSHRATSRRSRMSRVPLIVLGIAVLATLASFLAAMWPGQPRTSPGPARETGGRRSVPAEPADPTGRTLPALEVVDGTSDAIALRSLLPAVIILMEECRCPASVSAAAAAVPSGVTVVALFSGVRTPGALPPGPVAGGAPVRSVADPAAGLRGFLRAPARPREAATLLVARSGEIIRFLPAPTSPLDYQAELARLAPA